MRELGLARRYAAALYGAADKRGIVDQVDKDLAAIGELLAGNRELYVFLGSPRVLEQHKRQMLDTVLGSRVQSLSAHFMQLLLDKRRFLLVQDVVESFSILADEHRGILRAKVRTPKPLEEAQFERLVTVLEARSQKKVRLAAQIDPEMIGGISVIVGDHLLDGSVRAELARLRDQLRSVSVV